MLFNPDTPTHNELNRWFSSTEIDEAQSVIKEVAQRLRPNLDRILSADSRWGTEVMIDPSRSHQVAMLAVLELLLGTLDPELSQSFIGQHFKSKIALVAEKLDLPKVNLTVREASEEDLRQWFGDSKPLVCL